MSIYAKLGVAVAILLSFVAGLLLGAMLGADGAERRCFFEKWELRDEINRLQGEIDELRARAK